jgi:hypothetical protein
MRVRARAREASGALGAQQARLEGSDRLAALAELSLRQGEG